MSGLRSSGRWRSLPGFGEQSVLAAILLLAAGMRLWQLSQNGFGRQYYAAGVMSMSESWRNFAFNAFDPGGFVSIDKPPLALWLQVLSAKLFGFSGWSVLLPQAVAGVLAVAALYALVRRSYGPTPAALSALVLATMPAAVAVDRSNNTESLLILVLLGAAWAGMRAAEQVNGRWLYAAMAVVGLGFNVKMGAALVLAPVVALAYWFASWQLPLTQRLKQQATAGAVLIAVALSWAVAFDLTPSASRPYAGSTKHNSMLELALVHNGLSRFFKLARPAAAPPAAGAASALPKPVLTDRSATGVQRLLRPVAAAQFGWLLPLALIGFAAAWVTARREDSRRHWIAALFWIGWLVGYWSVLSFAGGAVHTYYVAILGPPVAVFVGLGATRLLELWRSGRLHGVALAAAAVLTTLWQARIIVGNGLPAWDTPPVWIATVALTLMGLGIAWLLLSSTRAAMPRPLLPAALVLAPLLAFPTLAALSVVIVRPNVAVPVADIGRLLRGREDDNPRSVLRETFRRMNRERLLAFLKAGHKRETYIVAVPNAVVAAPLILATRAPVMAMGGYLGDDPVLSPQRLARMRDQGKLRYVLLGGFSLAPEKQRKALAAIGQWVRANGKPVTPELWSVRRRRAGRVTATIRYRNGWITVERRQLYDLARR